MDDDTSLLGSPTEKAYYEGYAAGIGGFYEDRRPFDGQSPACRRYDVTWERGYAAGCKARDSQPKFGPFDRFGPNDIWTYDEFERAQRP